MNEFITNLSNEKLQESLQLLIIKYEEEIYPEKRQQLLFEIQNLQNELNLRITSKSARDTRNLSWIVILLTVITIILSIITGIITYKNSIRDDNFKKEILTIQKEILEELKK